MHNLEMEAKQVKSAWENNDLIEIKEVYLLQKSKSVLSENGSLNKVFSFDSLNNKYN